jgi:NAD(P)-dependent dehydrogenase (short-subunit alcohol dehydrogenase family)
MGSLAPSGDRTLLVLGSGPGIGRSVTTVFASRRYGKVVLIARRAEQLKVEKDFVERTTGVEVGTYAVDLTDTKALLAALDDADATFGRPEAIFYNAARVLPSAFFEHPVEDIEYDLKINVSALYNISSRYLPYLSTLPEADPSSHPALIITSSALPHHPIPQYFALSLVKAAQRNLVQSLHLTYAPQGVHVGVINIGGPVSPDHDAWNPTNIAEKTWGWFDGVKTKGGSFEVVI